MADNLARQSDVGTDGTPGALGGHSSSYVCSAQCLCPRMRGERGDPRLKYRTHLRAARPLLAPRIPWPEDAVYGSYIDTAIICDSVGGCMKKPMVRREQRPALEDDI